MKRLAILVVIISGCSEYKYSNYKDSNWGVMLVRTSKKTGEAQYRIPINRKILSSDEDWQSATSFFATKELSKDREARRIYLKTVWDNKEGRYQEHIRYEALTKLRAMNDTDYYMATRHYAQEPFETAQ